MNHKEYVALAFQNKPNVSCLGSKMDFLAEISCHVKDKNLAGNIAECGVYKGGGARLLATVFPHKNLFLFDSFSGFVVNDSNGGCFNKGAFSDVSLNSVKEYLSDKDNCLFFQGWLPNSAMAIRNPFCLIHMDMDHYESTIQSLKVFWPLLVAGGAIVFDDWEDACCPGIKRAIEEFFEGRDKIVNGNQCVVFKPE